MEPDNDRLDISAFSFSPPFLVNSNAYCIVARMNEAKREYRMLSPSFGECDFVPFPECFCISSIRCEQKINAEDDDDDERQRRMRPKDLFTWPSFT